MIPKSMTVDNQMTALSERKPDYLRVRNINKQIKEDYQLEKDISIQRKINNAGAGSLTISQRFSKP